MHLSEQGCMIEKWWQELKAKFPLIDLDASVVMPNHFHGVVVLVGADLCVCPKEGGHTGPPLPKIIQWFKTMTTNEYIRGVKEKHWSRFNKRVWQRNYYEHIIRDEKSLNRIREYIVNNPLRWHLDRENPDRIGDDEFDKWLDGFQERPDVILKP